MPKIVDHDAYRKVMLEKCFDLFSKKGFHNVSMREICKEIGVSTGTLYHYFPAKENILEQMLPWAVETNIAAFNRDTENNLTLHQRLDEVAKFWGESEEFYKNLILLVIDLLREGNENSDKVFKYVIDIYKIGLTQNLHISPKLSKVIFTYLLGIIFNSLLTPNDSSYQDEILFLQEVLGSMLQEDEFSEVEFLKKMHG